MHIELVLLRIRAEYMMMEQTDLITVGMYGEMQELVLDLDLAGDIHVSNRLVGFIKELGEY